MTRRLGVLIGVLLVAAAGGPLRAADPSENPAEKAAETEALSWLGVVDAGKYGESWDQAAEMFRAKLTKAQWEAALDKARRPLGKVVKRELQGARLLTNPPSAPAGEYVVIQFATSFENSGAMIETIAPMKEKDGSWRVSGYFIK